MPRPPDIERQPLFRPYKPDSPRDPPDAALMSAYLSEKNPGRAQRIIDEERIRNYEDMGRENEEMRRIIEEANRNIEDFKRRYNEMKSGQRKKYCHIF